MRGLRVSELPPCGGPVGCTAPRPGVALLARPSRGGLPPVVFRAVALRLRFAEVFGPTS